MCKPSLSTGILSTVDDIMSQEPKTSPPAPGTLDSVLRDIKRGLRINTWLLAITMVMLLSLLVKGWHP